MFTRIAILLAILVAAVAPVRAGDAPINGGPGGQPFRFTCDDGSYLVGFSGRFGQWIDQIRPLCAQWLPSQQTFGKAQASVAFGESQGGARFEARCPKNYVIASIAMTFTFDENHRPAFLDSVGLACFNAINPRHTQSVSAESHGKTDDAGYLPQIRYSECEQGEAATGVRGRSGLFVDALGLICGAAPQPLTAGARSGPGQSSTTLDRQILNPRSGVGAAYGGSECIAGYVPRLARPTDDVCVTPESAARVVQENATANARRDSKGKYGPNSCIKGFVWREAFAGDLVCVTPEVRQLVRQENALAGSRSNGALQLP